MAESEDRATPRVCFFNFHSDQTYHFFRWVKENPNIDKAALVRDAINDVESDEWFALGQDRCRIARSRLVDHH